MNMKKMSITVALSCSLGILAPIHSMEHEQTTPKKIVCVDFDNVLTKTFTINPLTIIKLLPCILWHPLAIAYVVKDISAIMEKGEEIVQQPGITLRQTIIGVIQYLKDNNYGDFFDYQDTIIDIGMNPGPIDEVIQQIKELKQQGHILIGATNQDYAANCIYRKKLQQQGADLDELFEVILTRYAPETEIKNQQYNVHNNVHMADKGIQKPDKRYFDKLKKLAHDLEKNPSEFYLIDDADENIEGAKKAGFHGIHFELPRNPKTGKRRKAHNTSNQDLHRAAIQLKDKLVQEGLLK